jgi:hypothetical protein
MKGDFSRDTFDATRHFSRVLMQQGRVQLDADWNEQSAILLHYIRTLARDLIGPHAGPSADWGFEIKAAPDDNTNFVIGSGRYYVDGFLCENEPQYDGDGADRPVTYFSQPSYPLSREANRLAGDLLVYLDVWERHITTIEDDRIRESALGGPDTASRAQVVWQVKTAPVSEDEIEQLLEPETHATTWESLVEQWQPSQRGRLRVRVKPHAGSYTDPCITKPDANYRGAENQFYRVEIHKVSPDGRAATFKWSRDNGAVVAAWTGTDGNDLVVSHTRGFESRPWVEWAHDELELLGLPGELVKIAQVEDGVLTVDTERSSSVPVWRREFRNPKIRRWDQRASEKTKLYEGALALAPNSWIDLEEGIQVFFAEDEDEADLPIYRPGDYWVFPARVATGEVEWPQFYPAQGRPEPKALPPHGVEHHFAPLALITANAQVVDLNIRNLRCVIEPQRNCRFLTEAEERERT